jgi:TetR/AcrR family acrAB operon transcriptional repressor
MARRTKEEAEKTRARIMASALTLFAKKGYDRTTFNDVAARLKLTKGAVYWHFESKEALLMALVDEMFETFGRQIAELKTQSGHGADGAELTFRAVADLMLRDADMVVSSPKMAAFFMLMKCQVKWQATSMSKVREDLLTNDRFGPLQAFRMAIENDMKAGLVRQDVDAVQVATVCIAIWDGLVQARLDHFLACDLGDTLRKSYEAVWQSIKA